RVPQGFVAGVDVSEAMVDMAHQRSKKAIRRGLLEVKLGDSSSLSFPDNSFDKALCIHTLYFWRDPIQDLREIRRVLKPAGRFVLGFRAKSHSGSTADFPDTVYTFYSTEQVCDLLKSAGFEKIDTSAAASSPRELLLVAAQRPSQLSVR